MVRKESREVYGENRGRVSEGDEEGVVRGAEGKDKKKIGRSMPLISLILASDFLFCKENKPLIV